MTWLERLQEEWDELERLVDEAEPLPALGGAFRYRWETRPWSDEFGWRE
jgi:hypothetical protein